MFEVIAAHGGLNVYYMFPNYQYAYPRTLRRPTESCATGNDTCIWDMMVLLE